MVKLKRRYVNLILFMAVSVFVYLYIDYINKEERNFFYENFVLFGGANLNQSGCNLPLDLDPNDDSIKNFIKVLPDRIRCKLNHDAKVDLTFIDEEGTLRIRKLIGNFECFYRKILRNENDDNEIFYSEKEKIDPETGVKLDNHSTFIAIDCFDESFRLVYENIHFWLPKFEVPSAKNSRKTPSVVILVIESLSRLNYLRFMHKTKSSLEKMGNLFYLKGLTKLAGESQLFICMYKLYFMFLLQISFN